MPVRGDVGRGEEGGGVLMKGPPRVSPLISQQLRLWCTLKEWGWGWKNPTGTPSQRAPGPQAGSQSPRHLPASERGFFDNWKENGHSALILTACY